MKMYHCYISDHSFVVHYNYSIPLTTAQTTQTSLFQNHNNLTNLWCLPWTSSLDLISDKMKIDTLMTLCQMDEIYATYTIQLE